MKPKDRLDFCKYKTADTRTIDLNMKRHLTKSQGCLYFSLQCRRLLRVRECFCSRKRHVETPEEGRKWGESKGAGGGGKGEKRKSHFLSQNIDPSRA